MATSKPKRTMDAVGQSQHVTEETTKDKFKLTEDLALKQKATSATTSTSVGRLSPQISCTVLPEDKQMLNEITIYAINKGGKPLNTSAIIRALIHLGHKRKDELEF